LAYIGTGDDSGCVNEMMVKVGMAALRNGVQKPTEVYERLVGLEEEAKACGLGIWEEGVTDNVRNVTWSLEEPRMLLDELKGQKIDAVVESVRDGATLRLLLLPSMHYITMMLTGVRCPMMRAGADSTSDTEEHAEEAKYACESRLLNRDIKVTLEGVSNQNFVGSVVAPGNIALFLLKEGLAKCVDWSMRLLTSGSDSYRSAMRSAKTDKKRLWKNYVAPCNNIPTDQREYSGKVTEVVNGEVIIVKVGSAYKRVTLSSIRQPKPQAPVEGAEPAPAGPNRALYNVPYLFEAREFLRKKLVGKKVNVSVDYVRPGNNGFAERVCASVALGNQNIQEAIVSKGLATVVRYRQDDDQRAANYDALLLAEDKAMKNHNGLHRKGDPPTHRVADLAGDPAKSKQFLPFLQRVGRSHGVVEFVASGSRLRIFIPRETCLLTFLLSGISCPRGSRPATKQGPATEAEPYGEEALEFIKDQIMQREVEIEVESCDKAGNFIGYLFFEDRNMSVELVKEGLSSMHFTAERGKYFSQLSRCEQDAKEDKKRMWANFVEPVVVEKEEGSEISDSNKDPSGPVLKEVVVTHVEDCAKFWVQQCSGGPALITLLNQMRSELISSPPLVGSFTPRKGDLCAAVFPDDNSWYRARVVNTKLKDQVEVLFIDYGNSAVVSTSKIGALPSAYASLPGQASFCNLAFIIPPEDDEWLQDANAEFISMLNAKLSLNLVAKVNGIDHVSLLSDSKDVAQAMISSGLVEYEKQKNRNRYGKLMGLYEAAMSDAKKNRRARFQYGDFTQDDAAEFGYKQ